MKEEIAEEPDSCCCCVLDQREASQAVKELSISQLCNRGYRYGLLFVWTTIAGFLIFQSALEFYHYETDPRVGIAVLGCGVASAICCIITGALSVSMKCHCGEARYSMRPLHTGGLSPLGVSRWLANCLYVLAADSSGCCAGLSQCLMGRRLHCH